MRRALAVAVLCAAVAPAAAQGLFDDAEARRRIEILRGQLNDRAKAVDERLGKIEAAVSGAGDRSAVLELSSQIEALRGEIARMRGQVEVLANQAELAERRQKDLYLDIDTRLRKLETAAEQAPKPAAAAPTDAPAEVSAAETKAYQGALDQFKMQNYAMAVTAMQNFLVSYPNSSLASNAQYWVGMAHSGQRDYKAAIAAQRKLLSTWPESQKAPDALLSIASAQETMGDRKSAQKTLEEVIAKYPDSSAAASAKQRLAASARR